MTPTPEEKKEQEERKKLHLVQSVQFGFRRLTSKSYPTLEKEIASLSMPALVELTRFFQDAQYGLMRAERTMRPFRGGPRIIT